MRIAPSILAADFLDLRTELKKLEMAQADIVHLDIMDGHFVPNLTFGPPIVKDIRSATSLPLDAHLMVTNPETWADDLADMGVEYISFHAEATYHAHRLIARLRDRGVNAGLALNPGTSWESIRDLLPELDFVLIMSVNPGFAGQSFIPHALEKVSALSAYRHEKGMDFQIEVDGGVNHENAPLLAAVGADMLVAGAYVFKGEYAERIGRLKACSEI